jgi:hypothetical protein
LTTSSPVSGAINSPARPARPEPTAQVTVATRSGDHPSVAALVGFSATAAVAKPQVVCLETR